MQATAGPVKAASIGHLAAAAEAVGSPGAANSAAATPQSLPPAGPLDTVIPAVRDLGPSNDLRRQLFKV